MLPWQRPLDTRSRLCLHQIAWPRKPTARIKQRVASYHTTKVIAHKASYNKLWPKIGCHGNVPQHRWIPILHMIPCAHLSPKPNGISICLALFAQMNAECHCTLQWDAPSPRKNCPFPWGNLDPHLIRGSLGPPESPIQTASRSVQPFLQDSLVWQTDRHTGR